MKKITMLSIVVAVVLFTGCEEKAKDTTTDTVETTKEAANHVTNVAKELGASVSKVVDSVKDVADEAVEATKEVVEATKEVASEAVDNAKEAVATATTAVSGAEVYAKCAGCHGVDGKTLALGKSPVIAGQTKKDLVTKLNGYKAGTVNIAGMGMLMKTQVASMDDAAIDAVATYISALK